MDKTTDIQASEELTLPGNHAAASADGLVVDNANDNAGQESEVAALATGLQQARQRILALETALRLHGLID